MKVFNILFVDDDTDFLSLLEAFFDEQGIGVTCVERWEDALEIIKAKHFDLISTDLNMPGIDGIKLTKIVKPLAPEIPVVLLTAGPVTEIVNPAKEAGVYRVVAKPGLSEIVDIIMRRRGESGSTVQDRCERK